MQTEKQSKQKNVLRLNKFLSFLKLILPRMKKQERYSNVIPVSIPSNHIRRLMQMLKLKGIGLYIETILQTSKIKEKGGEYRWQVQIY